MRRHHLCTLINYTDSSFFRLIITLQAVQDITLTTLLGSNRVVMTAHQAFFTKEAIDKIVSTTIENASNYSSGMRGDDLPNSIC